MSAAEPRSPTPATGRAPTHRPLVLLALLGLAVQAVRLAWSWSRDPFAHVPINDAQVYWDWAARIARGRLVGDEPFLSAPLYPYLLGLLRTLGAGLLGTYVVQALLHVGTGLLLASAGRRRLGAAAGTLAGGLWMLALDPASSVPRVLAGSVQAFLVALVLERWSAFRGGGGPALVLGLLFGLACLSNPALLVGVPVIGLALWRAADLRAALLGLVAAGACIGLATAHNLAASGEWIPISAQAGVTFRHGNRPGATGTYTAAEGVSTSRIQQNRDALDEARAALGPEAGWKETSSYFFEQGLADWRADPAWALGLAGRKLLLFLFAEDYGDIHLASLEREEGLAPPAWTAPVRSAWLALPALVALGLWLRRRGFEVLPEALLLLVPLLVVCVFWYSPRYRLPAVPVMALAAGWLLVEARGRPLLALPFVLALAGGPLLRALDLERLDEHRAAFQATLAGVLVQRGELDAARAAYERARELGDPTAAVALADLARRAGDARGALAELRAATVRRPEDPYAWRSLATAAAQAAAEDPGGIAPELHEEARAAFERVLELDRNDWQAWLGLGNVRLALGAADAAREAFARAVDLAPDRPEVHLGRARAAGALGDGRQEREALEQVLALSTPAPGLVRRLADLRVAAGERGSALALLGEALERDPSDPGLLLAASWIQATAPEPELRDGDQALQRARAARPRDPREEVERLDCLAAAHAELGQGEAALGAAREALERLEAAGQEAWAAELRARLAAYGRGEAWREAPR